MNLIELYELNINPNPTGVELYELFKRFDLHQVVVVNPISEWFNEMEAKSRKLKRDECAKWIIENRKI